MNQDGSQHKVGYLAHHIAIAYSPVLQLARTDGHPVVRRSSRAGSRWRTAAMRAWGSS